MTQKVKSIEYSYSLMNLAETIYRFQDKNDAENNIVKREDLQKLVSNFVDDLVQGMVKNSTSGTVISNYLKLSSVDYHLIGKENFERVKQEMEKGVEARTPIF